MPQKRDLLTGDEWILVADDVPDNVTLIGRILTRAGFRNVHSGRLWPLRRGRGELMT